MTRPRTVMRFIGASSGQLNALKALINPQLVGVRDRIRDFTNGQESVLDVTFNTTADLNSFWNWCEGQPSSHTAIAALCQSYHMSRHECSHWDPVVVPCTTTAYEGHRHGV